MGVLICLYYRVIRWVRIQAGFGDYKRVVLDGADGGVRFVAIKGASHSFREHDKYVPIIFEEMCDWLDLDGGEQ